MVWYAALDWMWTGWFVLSRLFPWALSLTLHELCDALDLKKLYFKLNNLFLSGFEMEPSYSQIDLLQYLSYGYFSLSFSGWLLREVQGGWLRQRRFWFVLTTDSLDYYSGSDRDARRLGTLVLTSLCSVLWPDKHTYKQTGNAPANKLGQSQSPFPFIVYTL